MAYLLGSLQYVYKFVSWKSKSCRYLFHDTGLSTDRLIVSNHESHDLRNIHREHMSSWQDKDGLRGDLHGSYNYCSKSSIFIMLSMLASKSVRPCPWQNMMQHNYKGDFKRKLPIILCAKHLRRFSCRHLIWSQSCMHLMPLGFLEVLFIHELYLEIITFYIRQRLHPIIKMLLINKNSEEFTCFFWKSHI